MSNWRLERDLKEYHIIMEVLATLMHTHLIYTMEWNHTKTKSPGHETKLLQPPQSGPLTRVVDFIRNVLNRVHPIFIKSIVECDRLDSRYIISKCPDVEIAAKIHGP